MDGDKDKNGGACPMLAGIILVSLPMEWKRFSSSPVTPLSIFLSQPCPVVIVGYILVSYQPYLGYWWIFLPLFLFPKARIIPHCWSPKLYVKEKKKKPERPVGGGKVADVLSYTHLNPRSCSCQGQALASGSRGEKYNKGSPSRPSQPAVWRSCVTGLGCPRFWWTLTLKKMLYLTCELEFIW